MSAVIAQTKRLYQQILKLEIVGLVVISVALVVVSGYLPALSFVLGSLVALLPQASFIFWVFFRKKVKAGSIKPLYQGEALKWLITIGLMISVFMFFKTLIVIAFFCGYSLTIIANSVLPLLLKQGQLVRK